MGLFCDTTSSVCCNTEDRATVVSDNVRRSTLILSDNSNRLFGSTSGDLA